MTSLCPNPDELDRLVDGEVTENRGDVLREHLRLCAVCGAQVEKRRLLVADIQAPVPGLAVNELIAGVLQRLDQPPPRSRLDARLVWGGAAALASAAAGLILFLTFQSPPDSSRDEGSFQARGAHSQRPARQVGTNLYTVGGGTRRVEPGAELNPDAALVLAYRNLEKTTPLYLLAFAVDAKSTIHWLYPAYLTDGADPKAVELAYTERETALPETVVLDQPAPGASRFVVVISPSPERVSSVERLSPDELKLPSLRRRWPDAVITELPIKVARSEKR